MSAALVFSSLSAVSASAENYGDGKNLIVLGDSIAAGYGLSDKEFDYGRLCADYLGGNVENYAHSGDTTQDLLDVVGNFSSAQNTAVGQADVVIISIGANDLMQGFARKFLKYAVSADMLSDEYSSLTDGDIDAMEKINVLSVRDMLDEDKIKAAVAKDPLTFAAKLRIMGTEVDAEVTQASVMPNIQKTVSELKAINPNVRIIVQTIYNPLEFETGYLEASHGADYIRAVDNVRRVFKNVLNLFSQQLNNIEGIEVADICSEFASLDENSAYYSWYFTNMQAEKTDIHPSQKGHLAIAVNILNVIGEKNENGSKLRQIYNSLPDKEKYPAAALANYENVCGTYSLGDVNDDGKIDSNDASAILKEYSLFSTRKDTTFTKAQKKSADINNDDFYDARDASTLLNYYGNISTVGNDTIKKYLLK